MAERQYTQTPDGFDNIPFTDEEQAEWEAKETGKDAQLLIYRAENMRQFRNEKLAETDWTASSDVTMSDAMKAYRQALRDVPAQSGFPTDINWPTLGE